MCVCVCKHTVSENFDSLYSSSRLKTQVTADAGEDVEKEEHSFTVGGVVRCYNHSGNKSGSSSENWT